MSNLTCYCSIATVVCISYIGLLLPTLFGISCRRNVCICQRTMLANGPGKARIDRTCSESLRATFFTKSLYHMPFQLPIDPIRAGLGDASGIEKREERVSNTCLQDLGEGRSATWQYHCSNFSRQTFFYWFQHRTLEPGQNIIQSGGQMISRNDFSFCWYSMMPHVFVTKVIAIQSSASPNLRWVLPF